MAADVRPLQNSTVRILNAEGGFHGVGYLIDPVTVVTCAHVVADAAGIDRTARVAPDYRVTVEACFLDSTDGEAPAAQGVPVTNGWHPVRTNSPMQMARLADIAVLELDVPLARPEIPLAPLSRALALAGSELCAFGGPCGHEHVLVDLRPLRLGNSLGNGWYRIDASDSNYCIEPGCSGAPVLDLASATVVGLIVQGEKDKAIPSGFLLPVQDLRRALQLTHGQSASREAEASRLSRLCEHITGGGLVYGVAIALRKFLAHYLGTPKTPRPFAGRDGEFDTLNAWLDEPAPKVRFITAPAGRGKSSLIVHWLASVVVARPDIHLLFLPVSIRFQTNDEVMGLMMLYEQLVRIFPEIRLAEAISEPQDIRSQIGRAWAEFIPNRHDMRFILVVDGVDEAVEGWVFREVLPYDVPDNLAVLISGRSSEVGVGELDWVDRFAFDPQLELAPLMILDPLTREEVGEAVSQLGHTLKELADHEAVLDALWELTDRGDPLMVGLWAGLLWAKRGRFSCGCSVKDLKGLEPGIAGFFREWCSQQVYLWSNDGLKVDPYELELLLCVLASAYGPLHADDLGALAHAISLPADWDKRQIRKVLGNAPRLLVGDGADQPITFVHPRIADYFQQKASERKGATETIREAFLEWGQRVVNELNSGALKPLHCSTYLLHHYTTHINAAGMPVADAINEHYLPLLDGGWHTAWSEEEGTYRGFLVDLARIDDAIHLHNQKHADAPPFLIEEIACQLYRTSIESIVFRMPGDLLRALLDAHLWSVRRVLSLAESVVDPVRRFQLAMVAIEATTSSTEHEWGVQLAVAATASMEGRANALAALAPHLTGDSALLERALLVVESIDKDCDCAHALEALALHLAGDNALLARALTITDNIQDDNERGSALAALAPFTVGTALRARALTINEGIAEVEAHFLALEALGEPLTGETALLERVLIFIEGLGDEYSAVDALKALAAPLTGETALLERALKIAEGIDNDYDRVEALSALVVLLTGEKELLERTLAIVENVEDQCILTKGLIILAPLLAVETALLKRALVVAEGLKRNDDRATALAALAAYLPDHERRATLKCVLVATESNTAEFNHMVVLVQLAPHLANETALLDRALMVAQRIEIKSDRASALVALAANLPSNKRRPVLERAMAAIEDAEDNTHRTAALINKFVTQLAGEAALLDRALMVVESIGDEHERAMVIEALSSHLSGQPSLLERALAAVEGIGEKFPCVYALEALSAQLAGETALLERALAFVEGIKDSDFRAEALEALIGQFAGERTLLEQALAVAERFGNDYLRSKVLKALAPQLAGETELLVRVLAAAEGIGNESIHADVIEVFAAHFAGDMVLLERALATVEGFENVLLSANTSAKLAAYLPDDKRIVVLKQAQVATMVLRDNGALANALVALVTHLPNYERRDVLERVLKAFENIENETWYDDDIREEVMAALAPHLVEQMALLEWALAASVGDRIGKYCDGALAVLVPHLAGQAALLERALAAAESHKGHRALVALAANLAAQPALLERVIRVAENFSDNYVHAEVLSTLAPKFVGERACLEQVLTSAERIGRESYRAEALVTLAPHFSGQSTLLERALAVAVGIGREDCRSEVLKSLAPHLTCDTALLKWALAAAEGIKCNGYRVKAMAALARYLPDHECRMILNRIMVTIESSTSDLDRNLALRELASRLVGEAALLQRALTAAEDIENVIQRVSTTMLLAVSPSNDERRAVLERALAAIEGVEDDFLRAEVLIHAPSSQLAGETALLKRALTVAEGVKQAGQRGQALEALAPSLTGETALLEWALEVAVKIKDEDSRVPALKALIAQLAGETSLLKLVLRIAEGIGYDSSCKESLMAVSPHLASETALLERAIGVAEGFGYDSSRAEAFIALAPHLTGETALLERALMVAEGIGSDYDRAQALKALGEVAIRYQQFISIVRSFHDSRSLLSILGILAPTTRALATPEDIARLAVVIDRFSLWNSYVR